MCTTTSVPPKTTASPSSSATTGDLKNVLMNGSKFVNKAEPPTTTQVTEPSMVSRYTCASIMIGIFAVWGKYSFVQESEEPWANMHGYQIPLVLTTLYLVSLPILHWLVKTFVSSTIDMKLLLKETMVLYNGGQVIINGWMVYRFVYAVLYGGHSFVGDFHNPSSGAAYAVWVHYADKYLEFFDTYFMVLRGRMDQVSFLHVYHHTSIAWAWWAGVTLWPCGDSYFGAMLNSIIHVLMYSYYTLSLLRIPCPWKKYLTVAQLVQFSTVLLHTAWSIRILPSHADWKPYTALAIQAFEMISLFILFMHFYRKTYSSKKTRKTTTTDVVVNNNNHQSQKDEGPPTPESVPSQQDSSSDANSDTSTEESSSIISSNSHTQE